MCRPTRDSTTAPAPSGPTDERIVYHLTDAGRRALQAASPRCTESSVSASAPTDGAANDGSAQDDRHEQDDEPAPERHRLTVCGRWRHNSRVPDLRMTGLWLRKAGFDLGQKYEVQVEEGRLVVLVV